MIKQESALDVHTYAKKMRAALSGPDIYKKDLSLNHEYFNTKKGYYWSQQNIEALTKGLKEFGVGEWKKINKTFFNNTKSEIELEMRTCILLSCVDLSPYIGQKIDLSKQKAANTNQGAPRKRTKAT